METRMSNDIQQNAVECRYNAVQYNMILRKSFQ